MGGGEGRGRSEGASSRGRIKGVEGLKSLENSVSHFGLKIFKFFDADQDPGFINPPV
jgi:hypothetical protein